MIILLVIKPCLSHSLYKELQNRSAWVFGGWFFLVWLRLLPEQCKQKEQWNSSSLFCIKNMHCSHCSHSKATPREWKVWIFCQCFSKVFLNRLNLKGFISNTFLTQTNSSNINCSSSKSCMSNWYVLLRKGFYLTTSLNPPEHFFC